MDSIIIPARVHPNNGPVTIYVPAIESLPFNRKSLLYSGPVPCVVTMWLYCRWLVKKTTETASANVTDEDTPKIKVCMCT